MKTFVAIACVLLGCQAAQATTLTDAELDKIHAGFIQIDGLQFSLGAVVKSSIDGNMVLQSTMSLDETGQNFTHMAGLGVANLADASARGLTVVTPGAMGMGVLVPGADGATAIIHDFTGSQIANIVANNASNRMITQNTDVVLVMPGLEQMQQGAALARAMTGIQDSLAQSLMGASKH